MKVFEQRKRTFLIVAVILVVIMIASLLIIEIISVPGPAPAPSFYPGEVIQYQNYTLTPISTFIYDIAQHPDVAIDGTQNINQATYHLTISGLVNKSLDYTYDDVINNFNSTQQVANFFA